MWQRLIEFLGLDAAVLAQVVTAFLWGKFLANALGGETGAEAHKTDWISDDVRLIILNDTFTPAQDTQEFYSEIKPQELATAGGYTVGGAAVANRTVTYTAGTNTIKFDGDDVAWPNASFTARYGALINFTPGTDATRPVISLVNLGGNMSPVNGTFTVQWNANGIWEIVVGAEA